MDYLIEVFRGVKPGARKGGRLPVMLCAIKMAITIRRGRPRLKGTQRMETLSKHSLRQSDARRDQEDGIGGRDDIFYEDTEHGGDSRVDRSQLETYESRPGYVEKQRSSARLSVRSSTSISCNIPCC